MTLLSLIKITFDNLVPDSGLTIQTSVDNRMKYIVPESVSVNTRDNLQSLEDEVTRRFQDFKKIDPTFSLLCYPISAEIGTIPEDCLNLLT
ncbi:hypothetical protein TNCV_807171 [Trichonephila clavipes]|nr:hypothetical protein TNCV_807171 [Trichonephila clavipes]